jgi:CheY-like chemotaxis protein
MEQQQRTILVIDDDTDILLFLEFLLRDAGYRVVTSATGAILGELEEQKLPDLVLLDLVLADTNGRVLTRQLKDNSLTAHIPVILYSAHPNAEREAQAAGADGFLAKPFEIDEILDKIVTYL